MRRSSASLKKAALANRLHRRSNIRRERKRPSLFRKSPLPHKRTLKNIQGINLIIAATPAIIKIYSEHPAVLQDLMDCPGSYSEGFKRNSQRAARGQHWENHRRATRHGSPASVLRHNHPLGWEPEQSRSCHETLSDNDTSSRPCMDLPRRLRGYAVLCAINMAVSSLIFFYMNLRQRHVYHAFV